MSLENKERVDASNAELLRRYRVLVDYRAEYPDPISVGVDEIFQVSEKVELWNNNPDWVWVWCTDQRGKQGWVPQTVITLHSDGRTGTARSPYSARELTVVVGEELVAHQEESGWLWCANRQGKSGWVPLNHLTPLAIH